MILVDSKCLICGERFKKLVPRARCYRCDTPHHDECAKWNGLRCSVFGCGGKLQLSSAGRSSQDPQ